MRLLLVEDDDMIGSDLVAALGRVGFAVDWVREGRAGELALTRGHYAGALLDLGLPGRSGLDVLRAARARGDRTPIVVVTARDGVDDRVCGLDGGADDYVVKPFALRELLARLRAVIRRRDGHAQSLVGTADVQLDLATREIQLRSSRSPLSAREFALLHALLERPGAILSREQLEERMYGWDRGVCSNAVEVVIHGLRKRFGPDIIRNVRGLGWRIPREPT